MTPDWWLTADGILLSYDTLVSPGPLAPDAGTTALAQIGGPCGLTVGGAAILFPLPGSPLKQQPGPFAAIAGALGAPDSACCGLRAGGVGECWSGGSGTTEIVGPDAPLVQVLATLPILLYGAPFGAPISAFSWCPPEGPCFPYLSALDERGRVWAGRERLGRVGDKVPYRLIASGLNPYNGLVTTPICGVTVDGFARCEIEGAPPPEPPSGTFDEVAVGPDNAHACAITTNDELVCWEISSGAIVEPARLFGGGPFEPSRDAAP